MRMSFGSMRACLDAYGGGKSGLIEGAAMCLEPWRLLLALFVILVGTTLAILLALRDGTRGEDENNQRESEAVSEEELERRIREMQNKWHRRVYGG